MSFTKALSQFACTEVPDPELQDIVVEAIADCFGCILAGVQSPVARQARAGLAGCGTGNAIVYGSRQIVPPLYAALLNAVSGHAYELDDWEEKGNTHPTVVLLPALLSAASIKPVSGKELFCAYAVGFEIITRLGEMITLDHYARGFHATATLGAIGATVAAARLLGLKPEQMSHAIAISVSQAIGYTAQFGSNTKALHAGFAARAGLESVLLAASGVTGNPEVLDGRRGMIGLLGDFSQDRIDFATSRLGNPWGLKAQGIVLKPWPSCGYAHRLMTAALELRSRLGNRTCEISSIHVTQPDFHNVILAFDRPSTRDEALFSGPACIAQMLLYGDLTLEDCEKEFWKKSDVSALMSRCVMEAEPAKNPEVNYDPGQPDTLKISLQNKEIFFAECKYPIGSPQNRMSKEMLAAKYASATGRAEDEFKRILRWIDASDVAAFFKALEE